MHRVLLEMAPYEPFGFRNKEDIKSGRFFWINRKQDRFTLTCNYREHGITKNGKKYGRFKKLFSLSVTLREPKTLGKMSLNVFYHGNVGGRKYNILNVTRNPSIVLGALPSVMNELIIEEILSLAERQKIFNNAELNKIKKTIILMKAEKYYDSVICMKLIQHVTCPVVASAFNQNANSLKLDNIKIQKNNFEAFVLPAFIMPLIRNTDIEGLAKKLNIYNSNVAYFKSNISKIDVNALYYLNLTQGLIEAETQRKILNLFISGDSSEFDITARSWDTNLNGLYINKLRQALKTLNITERSKVLLDSRFMDYAPRIIKIWLGRSKFEKKFIISESVNNVEEFYFYLVEYLNERKIELNTVKPNSITYTLDSLVSSGIFENDNSFSNSIVGTFGGITVWLPKDSQDSGTYQTWFSFNGVKKESPLWKPIFDDDAFIKNPLDLLGFYNKAIPAKPSGEANIVFSPKMYVKFLENLNALTEQVMNKYDIKYTSRNKAFVSLIIIAFYSYDYAQFRKLKNIPPKIFNLYVQGLHPNIIEFAIEKRIPENIVSEYKDIPLEWAEKMLGAKEGRFSRKEYVF